MCFKPICRVRKVRGRCLEGVWKVSGRCLEGVWKVSEKCLEGVLKVSWKCLRGVWKVSERCLEGVWKVSGRCLEGAWKVSGRCLEVVWGLTFLGNQKILGPIFGVNIFLSSKFLVIKFLRTPSRHPPDTLQTPSRHPLNMLRIFQWKKFGILAWGVGGKSYSLIKSGWCLVSVLSWECLNGVWKVIGRFLEDVWKVSGVVWS